MRRSSLFRVAFFLLSVFCSVSWLIASPMIQNGNELIRCTENGDLEYSRNNAVSWSNLFLHNYTTGKFRYLLAYKNELLAITDNGLFYSRNNGRSWSKRFTPTYTTGEFDSMTISGNELLAQTSKGVFYSRNNGVSWSKRSN